MSERPSNRAYLALGSNIDPERNLPAAVQQFARFGRVAAVSRVWETAPVGFRDQPNFLNAAVLLKTPLSVDDILMRMIPEVETSLGRVRDPQNKNGPRTVDVDLVLFNDAVLERAGRRIPDPAILEHVFVAVPLSELDPEFLHPVTGRTLSQIASGLSQDREAMRLRSDVVLARIGSQVAVNRPGGTSGS